MTDAVRLAIGDGVATLTLDRPTVRNALGPEEWRALDARLDAIEADAAVRVVVIEGAGGTFSAGGDLATMPARLAQPRHVRRANLLRDARVIARLTALKQPTIAVIEGAAVGAGLSLALACDLRYATTTARLGATFHRVGLTGDFGVLWTLPRLVGPTRAFELLLGGELVDGARAEAIGLVTRAFAPERLREEVGAVVARLVSGPPLALAATKRGLWMALEQPLDVLLAYEADAQAGCSRSDDAQEGVRAFGEKRAPRFTGR
jgi:2-(1,2-epoxy-1,2-dihydrophenyl)acetyl-CoA isomerase